MNASDFNDSPLAVEIGRGAVPTHTGFAHSDSTTNEIFKDCA